MTKAPLRWIGRRGAVLILFGLAFVVYGTRIVAEPVDYDSQRALLHLMTPDELRASVWITCGVVSAAAPFVCRWTRRDETAAFILALAPPLATAASFLLGWAAYLLPLPIAGDPGGFGSAAIWLTLAGVLMIISGWPEHPDLPPTSELTS